jgi:hypothetical protein
MAMPHWFTRLLPRRNQSFRERFVGALVLWGCPMIIWETLSSGVLHEPAALPFFLLLEIPGTLIGVLGFAVLEHLFYRVSKRAP